MMQAEVTNKGSATTDQLLHAWTLGSAVGVIAALAVVETVAAAFPASIALGIGLLVASAVLSMIETLFPAWLNAVVDDTDCARYHRYSHL